MTRTTVQYTINGQPIEGWDENDFDAIDLEAAAANLTAYERGDRLTAYLVRIDDDGREHVEDSQTRTL